ncbi:hypothetical protein LXL04_010718 [Taraxacum kok-saghyz]
MNCLLFLALDVAPDAGYPNTRGYIAPYKGATIRKAGIIDEAFNTAQQESYEPTRRTNTNGAQEGPSTRPTGNKDSLWMAAYRDMIAEEIMNTQ